MTHKWLRVVAFAHLLLFALVVGVFWGTWFSLSRSIDAISASTFLEVGHTMIANLGGPMSVLFPAAVISAVPLLIGFRRRRGIFFLVLVGTGLLVAALVITLTVNVPIDGAIARWTIDTLPPDWTSIRDRWETFHAARTFASVAGFGFTLAAIVWSRAPGSYEPDTRQSG